MFVTLALLSAPLSLWAEGKVYPTTSLAKVRINTHNAINADLYNDPFALQFSSWSVLNSSQVWVSSGQIITIYTADLAYGATEYIVTGATISLEDYTQTIIEDAKIRAINKIADDEGQILMVLPSTDTYTSDWRGWCFSLVNGKVVAVSCP